MGPVAQMYRGRSNFRAAFQGLENLIGTGIVMHGKREFQPSFCQPEMVLGSHCFSCLRNLDVLMDYTSLPTRTNNCSLGLFPWVRKMGEGLNPFSLHTMATF